MIFYGETMNKIIFQDENKVGITWFIPNDEFEQGVPCKGILREVYLEGSVYIGDGEYDGENFFRQGHGIQYFENSSLTSLQINAPHKTKIDRFVGNYDRFKSDWMYGNGIWYFVDKNGNPQHFCKGFYMAATRIGDWHGEFDYDTLLTGYTKDMELDDLPKYVEKVKILEEAFENVSKCTYLFMGDSWIDFWRDENCFSRHGFVGEGYDVVNVGIGGTAYSDWTKWIDRLVVRYNPDKILINLGFNDLHHGQTADEVYSNFLNVISQINEKLPNSKIFITSITHCSVYMPFHDAETLVNERVIDYCKDKPNLTYLPVSNLFMINGKMIENMDDFCIEDKLHLNDKGYAIWGKFVIENIAK